MKNKNEVKYCQGEDCILKAHDCDVPKEHDRMVRVETGFGVSAFVSKDEVDIACHHVKSFDGIKVGKWKTRKQDDNRLYKFKDITIRTDKGIMTITLFSDCVGKVVA